jgi:hypothetical protein
MNPRIQHYLVNLYGEPEFQTIALKMATLAADWQSGNFARGSPARAANRPLRDAMLTAHTALRRASDESPMEAVVPVTRPVL